jgi:hypothetical protein
MRKGFKMQKWNQKEETFLKKNSKVMTIIEIAKKLRRGKSGIAHKLSRLGYKTRFFHFEPVTKLSETQKSYIAGAIDGEGCITFGTRKNTEEMKPIIIIANCSFSWLESIKNDIGSGTVYTKKIREEDRDKNWKTQYRYQITALRAKWLAKEIYPYIRLKKEQVKVLLSMPRAWKRTPSILHKRRKLLQKMRLLNQRGIHPSQSSM